MSVKGNDRIKLAKQDGFLTATNPADTTPLNVAFISGPGSIQTADLELGPLTQGGPSEWQENVPSPIVRGNQEGPFQWDSFTLP